MNIPDPPGSPVVQTEEERALAAAAAAKAQERQNQEHVNHIIWERSSWESSPERRPAAYVAKDVDLLIAEIQHLRLIEVSARAVRTATAGLDKRVADLDRLLEGK